MATKIVTIRLNAFVDGGTGRTAEQQAAWARDAASRLLRMFLPCPARRAMGDDQVVFVMLSSDMLKRGYGQSADAAIDALDAVADTAESTVSEAVANAMGRHAAYCTVREHVGDWPTAGLTAERGNDFLLPAVLGGGRISA